MFNRSFEMYSVMFVKEIIFLTFLENFESLIFFFFFHRCGVKRIRSFDREIVESWGGKSRSHFKFHDFKHDRERIA